MSVQVITPADTSSILTTNDIPLESITSIILSHSHFDHLGDPSLFPPTTSLTVGPGFRSSFTPGYPTSLSSPVPESALENRDVIELDFSSSSLTIADLSAIDYFSDGSLFLLSTPGHSPGHISALARVHVNPDLADESSFLLLAGDLCHHPGELRPSLVVPLQPQRTSPSITIEPPTRPANHICPGLALAIHPAQNPVSPFYEPAEGPFNANPDEMKKTISKVTLFDADPNIMVLISHDHSLLSTIPLFPADLNDWKEKGYKEASRWTFLRDFELPNLESHQDRH